MRKQLIAARPSLARLGRAIKPLSFRSAKSSTADSPQRKLPAAVPSLKGFCVGQQPSASFVGAPVNSCLAVLKRCERGRYQKLATPLVAAGNAEAAMRRARVVVASAPPHGLRIAQGLRSSHSGEARIGGSPRTIFPGRHHDSAIGGQFPGDRHQLPCREATSHPASTKRCTTTGHVFAAQSFTQSEIAARDQAVPGCVPTTTIQLRPVPLAS